MKVRCIDAKGRTLTAGRVYTVCVNGVNSLGEPLYELTEILNQRFRQSRFEIVSEIVGEYTFTEADCSRPPAKINEAPTVDTSDWRVWRDHNQPATNCACGIPRAQCAYHKEIEHDSGY